EWEAGADERSGRYRLTLTNRSSAPLEGFRLGLSGPARISDNAEVIGGRVVARLSNFADIAPEPGFVLATGASWTIAVKGLDYPIRHWTDGATAGFVIHANGTTTPALTIPTRLANSEKTRKRGTMR